METKQKVATYSNNEGDGVEDDVESGVECPLFMDGLPSDFRTNPQLAALASLLDDEDEDDGDAENGKTPLVSLRSSTRRPHAGGGKARSEHRGARMMSSPYQLPDKPKPKKATIGEAHLFMKMWKL
jgi:hypothetical protein